MVTPQFHKKILYCNQKAATGKGIWFIVYLLFSIGLILMMPSKTFLTTSLSSCSISITKWFKEEKCRMRIDLSSTVYNYFRHHNYHCELSSFLYISYANENWSSVRFLARLIYTIHPKILVILALHKESPVIHRTATKEVYWQLYHCSAGYRKFDKGDKEKKRKANHAMQVFVNYLFTTQLG